MVSILKPAKTKPNEIKMKYITHTHKKIVEKQLHS